MRATQPSFKSPVIPSTLELVIRLSTRMVRLTPTSWSSALDTLACRGLGRQPHCTSPIGSGAILSDPRRCLTAYRRPYRRGLLSPCGRVNPNPGLLGRTVLAALVRRLPSFGRITALILMGPSPQSLPRPSTLVSVLSVYDLVIAPVSGAVNTVMSSPRRSFIILKRVW